MLHYEAHLIIKRSCSYGLNTSELDHITDKLAGALMRPLQERIVQLEEENRNLQGMLDETNHALALQVLATAACGATENAIISPAADEFQLLFCARKEIICNFAASNTETKRMSTVAMNELWAYLKSLSLSAGNKAWLAERLIESSRADKLAETDEFACFSGNWGDDMPVNEYAESLRSAHVDEARAVETW